MTPARAEAECMRYARSHEWDMLAHHLAILRRMAERDHPLTTEVLSRAPAPPAPLDPSDPE